jgi:hypothetical protein
MLLAARANFGKLFLAPLEAIPEAYMKVSSIDSRPALPDASYPLIHHHASRRTTTTH